MAKQAKQARQVSKNRLLLVEGRDEQNLGEAFLESLRFTNIQVFDAAGKTSFVTRGEAVLSQARTAGITLASIGIIRDADQNPKGAFRSVQGALRRLRLPCPSSPSDFTANVPSVGVFISPDAQSTGSLETLCWNSIRNTIQATCVDQFVQCLRDNNALESSNEWKTRTHAFLASKQNPVARVGEGALAKYWEFDSPAFNGLRAFLRRLAGQ
jgi:hypothetical protein